MRSAVVIVVSCLLLPRLVLAHGDLHARLHDAAAAIAENPEDGSLRLARARLHRLHEDWDAAFADVDAAGRLGADRDEIALVRTALLLDTGRPENALVVLDDLLTRRPAHAVAHTRRGAALAALGRPADAAMAYGDALAHTARREPRHYLARARAFAAAGALDAAIAALDAGITDLGPLFVFEEAAITFERQAGRRAAALARIDRVIRLAPRPEQWLALRADVLDEDGRSAEAHRDRRAALAAIQRLPRARRTTQTMLDLETDLYRHLTATGSRP